jgi:hypothetical protein
MTYKETDNLATIKVGDTLVMNDGTEHAAIKDNKLCHKCSLERNADACLSVNCYNANIHFRQLNP